MYINIVHPDYVSKGQRTSTTVTVLLIQWKWYVIVRDTVVILHSGWFSTAPADSMLFWDLKSWIQR